MRRKMPFQKLIAAMIHCDTLQNMYISIFHMDCLISIWISIGNNYTVGVVKVVGTGSGMKT